VCLWYLLTGAPSATGGRPDARRHLSSAFEADAGLVLMGVLIEKGELGALPSSLITVLPSFAVFDTSSTEADPSVSPPEIGELGAALSRFSLPLAASTSIHWPHITALFGMSNA
jgi:hypothetical protein